MNKHILIDACKTIGLTEFEIQTYFEIVDSINPPSVSEIAKKLSVERRKVYDAIDTLIEKDLIFKNETKECIAHPPRFLLKRINEIHSNISNTITSFEDSLSDLEALYETKLHTGSIQIHTTSQQCMKALTHIAKSPSDTLYIFGDMLTIKDITSQEFIEHFLNSLSSIHTKWIVFNNTNILETLSKDTHPLLQYKYIQSKRVDIINSLYIISGSQLFLCNPKYGKITHIEDTLISNLLIFQWKLLWSLI